MDFWEILNVEGVQFEIDDIPTEIRPKNAVEESRIENEGRWVDIQKYARRIELENRKKAIREHEIREKAKNYAKLIDAVISRFGKDNDVLLDALYWKEKLRKPNLPIGVLEDFVNWIEPIIKAQNENKNQNELQTTNKAKLFQQLLSKTTSKRKKAKKPTKTVRTNEEPTNELKTQINAQFRLYLKKGNKWWIIYTNSLDIEHLKAFYNQRFGKYTRTDIKSLYIVDSNILAIPVKKDELEILRMRKKVLSLAETIKAIETVRENRRKRRQIPKSAIKNAIIGFYRLFALT